MDLTIVLLVVAAVVLLALVGTAVFLILQKRSIERLAVERADELVSEAAGGDAPSKNVSEIRHDDPEIKAREAA